MRKQREDSLHWKKLGTNHQFLNTKRGVKETERDGKPKIVVARYNGRCMRCQTWMPKGTKIAHYGKGTAVHLECLPEELREWAREQARLSKT